MAPKRNDRVAPPGRPGAWEARSATSEAAKGWVRTLLDRTVGSRSTTNPGLAIVRGVRDPSWRYLKAHRLGRPRRAADAADAAVAVRVLGVR